MAKTLCPKCGSARVAEILYGMPAFTKELEQALERGDYVLGGCLIKDSMPSMHCMDCGHEFGDADER